MADELLLPAHNASLLRLCLCRLSSLLNKPLWDVSGCVLHINCIIPRDFWSCGQNVEDSFWMLCQLAVSRSIWIQTRSYCSVSSLSWNTSFLGGGGLVYNHLGCILMHMHSGAELGFHCLREHTNDSHFSGFVKNEMKWCYFLHFCLFKDLVEIFSLSRS